jgi:hypothetical protein
MVVDTVFTIPSQFHRFMLPRFVLHSKQRHRKSAYLSRKQYNILRAHAIVRSIIIHVNLLREFLLPRKRLAENPNVCPSTSLASSLMVTYVSSALLRFDFCEHSSCIFELCFGSRIHLQEYTCRERNTNPVL